MLHTRSNIVLAAMFLTFMSYAQISKVSYSVKFNEKTNLFDCYFKVMQGSAKSARERTQFSSQFTVMIPTGSKVTVAENHMPLQNNRDYNGDKANEWRISNKVYKPQVEPKYDFISITPSLSPVSYYNDLKEGEEVKLFSLKISPITNCGSNVLIFENNSRISSSSAGMDGGDFSNGFTVGNIGQKYAGNIYHEAPNAGVLKGLTIENKNMIKVSADISNTPYAPLSYEWFGPGNVYSDKSNLHIVKPDKSHEGKYKLIITDGRGCQDTKEFEITNIEDLKDAAISELAKSISTLDHISVFPNPASTNVALTINGQKGEKLNVNVADVNGRVVQSNVISKILTGGEDIFDVSVQQLNSGIYNLILNIDGKERSQRLIVIK